MKTAPWHSIHSDIWHDDTDCNTGNNIEAENRVEGEAGLYCQECEGLAAPPPPPPEPEPIAGVVLGSSYRNPLGDTAIHGYVGLDGKGQNGELLDPSWSAVNITALLPGMGTHDLHKWPEVAKGDYDEALRDTAAQIKQRAIVALWHEPMLVKGTRTDFLAAHDHAYGVIKEERPDLLIGPNYLGNWFDPGWRDKNGEALGAWLPPQMDHISADIYPRLSGRDFDELTRGFFLVRPDLPHVILETAAARDYAAGFYSSMEAQAPGHENLIGIYLWLSNGPLGDFRVEMLSPADRAALDSLLASEAFGRGD